MSPSIILEIEKFIEARIIREDSGYTSPCWNWQLSLGPSGYAYGFPPDAVRRRTRRMARVAFETYVGPIAGGLEIDHLCRNRVCINPEHLEAVTRAENMRRMEWKRSICLHGHPLEGDNIKVFSDGRRTCRKCNDAWWVRETEKRRAKRLVASA